MRSVRTRVSVAVALAVSIGGLSFTSSAQQGQAAPRTGVDGWLRTLLSTQGLDVPLRSEVVQNGEGKGSRFTGSGLSLTDHISPCEHNGNNRRLNRRWLSIAQLGDGLCELLPQV